MKEYTKGEEDYMKIANTEEIEHNTTPQFRTKSSNWYIRTLYSIINRKKKPNIFRLMCKLSA